MKINNQLIDAVLKQIQIDIENNYFTAIEEMLEHLEENVLYSFLTEESLK